MKLVLSPRAVRRLAEIGQYIAADNPRAARRVEAALRRAFTLLAVHPRIGRVVHPQLRRFVVPRYPYIILYRLDERAGQITIATIRHAAQRPLPASER